MRSTLRVVVILLSFALAVTVPLSAQRRSHAATPTAVGAPAAGPGDFDYQQIDFKDANGVTAAKTQVYRINAVGAVVGAWWATATQPYPRGFVMQGGVFTSIDEPGALGTAAWGINNHGHIVGTYTDAAKVSRGFLLIDGHYLPIDIEEAKSVKVYDINDSDVVLGNYVDRTSGDVINFLWKAGNYNGAFADVSDSTFAKPGAAWAEGYGLNNRGDVVGHFASALDPNAAKNKVGTGHMFGFLRRDGAFREFDWPGEADGMSCLQGIGDQGDAVGHVSLPATAPETGMTVYGYVWKNGRYTAILRIPGAVNTYPTSISASGVVAGYFALVPGSPHGFIATLKPPTESRDAMMRK